MIAPKRNTMITKTKLTAPGRNLCKINPVRIMAAPINTIRQIGAPLGRFSQNEPMIWSRPKVNN